MYILPPKSNISREKKSSWKTILSFWKWSLFRITFVPCSRGQHLPCNLGPTAFPNSNPPFTSGKRRVMTLLIRGEIWPQWKPILMFGSFNNGWIFLFHLVFLSSIHPTQVEIVGYFNQYLVVSNKKSSKQKAVSTPQAVMLASDRTMMGWLWKSFWVKTYPTGN